MPRAAITLLFFLLSASVAAGGPLTDKGTQPGLTYPMNTPGDCAGCHGQYDGVNNLEPWDTWAGSLMAQAGRDPIFWAALDVANNDLPGVGDFCLRCHAPTGWLDGRSEPPGGSPDGCGLEGKLDETNKDFDGLTCHFCHRMMVNPSPPAGEDPVYFENGQFWIDDTDCAGAGEPCRRGPYDYPADGASPPPHAWAFSQYLEDSDICGNCHNVTNPVKTLIQNGVDTGIPYPIERTFMEWQQSDFSNQASPEFKTCQNCHMPDSAADPAFVCSDMQNNHTGDLPIHQLAGGNSWIPEVLRQEYPNLNLDLELAATRDWALDMLQNQSATVAVITPADVTEGGDLVAQVQVTNLTGHKLPTGYPEGRRLWLNVQARDGLNNLIWESGLYDMSTGILTQDPQIKVYEAKPGIYNNNGTGECDCEDGAGNPMFHFVLNDCYELDNRIPPLGFTGMSDPETQPVNYSYPETSPGSGILVNYDTTGYSVPVPVGTVSPLTISATLYYQTISKEYVEFLETEAITNGFPNDCIERSSGFPTKTRAGLLKDMWLAYGKSAPVDMGTDAAAVSVTSVSGVGIDDGNLSLYLHQNSPNPIEPTGLGTRIAFRLPHDQQVRIDVFDLRGRHVRTLFDGRETAGAHSIFWDGRDGNGRIVSSGVYAYTLKTNSEVLRRRMVVVR
ncbi:MAG: FlgD immunoglobulin-like domain containing protein [Candidatus Krumholzibacteriota bacterium]